MKTIKGIKALQLTFSRLSLTTLAVAAIAPSLLMYLTGQFDVYFVTAWGASILYLALRDATRYEAGVIGVNSLGINIMHEVGHIALSLAFTLASFKFIHLVQGVSATSVSVASSYLLVWAVACTCRLIFAGYKGVEISPPDIEGDVFAENPKKTQA